MKILTPGHKYELDNFEQNQHELNQRLQFIEKVPVAEGSTEFKTVNDGTTNEEVLAVLIDHMQSLQSKFPCRENAIVITNLEESLMWLNYRTANRKAEFVVIKKSVYDELQKRVAIKDQPSIEKAMYAYDELIRLIRQFAKEPNPQQLVEFLETRRYYTEKMVEARFG